MIVAALYVDPRGPYYRMDGVDCWDEARDATGYPGPWPVVAHPPCGPWGTLRKNCKQQTADLGPIAVSQVRRFGGVLEHPCGSKLWVHCSLPRPGAGCDEYGGYTIQVDQVDWGHVARKRTWLYLVGVTDSGERPPKGTPTHWCSASNTPGTRGCVPPGIKIATRKQRLLTPPAFAEWLVYLARTCKSWGI